MNIRLKLVSILLLGLLITTFAARSIYLGLNNEAQNQVVEKSAYAVQMRRAIQAAVQAQSESFSNLLIVDIERSQAGAGLSGEFYFLGLLGLQSVDWYQSSNPLFSVEWAKQELLSLTSALNKSKDTVTWSRIAGPDGQIYFSVAIPLKVKNGESESKQLAVGVLPISVFSNISVVAKGDAGSVFVVDDQGFTLSYPDQKYVGSKITSHPVVAAILNNTKLSQYTNTEGQNILGGYDKIQNTNLYVVSTMPMAMNTLTNSFQSDMQIGLIAIAVFVLLGWLTYSQISVTAEQIQTLEANLRMAKSIAVPEALVIDQGDLKLRAFAKAIVTYLRKPLFSLTGLIHIAEAKSSNQELKGILDKMTLESRVARDFIENMGRAIKYDEPKLEQVDIVPVLDQVVGVFASDMKKHNIHCETDIAGSYIVRGNYEELKESFKSLLNFIVQELSKSSAAEKALQLKLVRQGGQVEILFHAAGADLKNEIRKKIFRPFQSEGLQQTLFGLDLPLAQHVINGLLGQVNIEKLAHDGFQIVIHLPIMVSLLKSQGATQVESMTPTTAPVEVVEANDAQVNVVTSANTSAIPADLNLVEDKTILIQPIETTTLTSDYIQAEQKRADSRQDQDLDLIKIRRPKVRLEI